MSRDPLRDIEPEFVWEVEDRRTRRWTRERFDRMAWARRVLDALRPALVDVVLVPGHRELRVERGHQWARPAGYTWAMVSVPDDASREEIALAMMDVAGVTRDEALVVRTLLALVDEEA